MSGRNRVDKNKSAFVVGRTGAREKCKVRCETFTDEGYKEVMALQHATLTTLLLN